MTAEDAKKIEQKKRVHAFCIALIEERITLAKSRIENAQHAANQEEKSSAGDKYETARAMGHLEKDMFSRQLATSYEDLARVRMINSALRYDNVQPGSMVVCDTITFFIGAGLGKQTIDGNEFFLLSPAAPLTKLMLGKKEGFKFAFTGKEVVILQIY